MSSPSRIKLNSCAPISITSSLFCGHLNRCFSSLFCQRQNPFRSQYRIFSIACALLQNAKRWPENGSRRRVLSTRTERLFIAFRISVLPGAKKTRILEGRKIISAPIHARPALDHRNQIPCRFRSGSVGQRQGKVEDGIGRRERGKILSAAAPLRRAHCCALFSYSKTESCLNRSCLSYNTRPG